MNKLDEMGEKNMDDQWLIPHPGMINDQSP